MDGDTIGFALLLGVPLFAISGLATALLRWIAGRGVAAALVGALILAWPIYYIVNTSDSPRFIDGLPLLLFTTPAMILGWFLALAWGRGAR